MIITKSELAEKIERNTPELLKSLPQWVLWKYQQVAGKDKPKKPPFQVNGRAATVDDPATWSSYQQAMTTLGTNVTYQGVGFMLERGIVAIDLDYCLTQVDGVRRITKTARRVFDLAHSYTEVSPSGKGLHIFLRGHLPQVNGQPQDGMRYGNGEMYEAKRYITVTGERVGGVVGGSVPKVRSSTFSSAKSVLFALWCFRRFYTVFLYIFWCKILCGNQSAFSVLTVSDLCTVVQQSINGLSVTTYLWHRPSDYPKTLHRWLSAHLWAGKAEYITYEKLIGHIWTQGVTKSTQRWRLHVLKQEILPELDKLANWTVEIGKDGARISHLKEAKHYRVNSNVDPR